MLQTVGYETLLSWADPVLPVLEGEHHWSSRFALLETGASGREHQKSTTGNRD